MGFFALLALQCLVVYGFICYCFAFIDDMTSCYIGRKTHKRIAMVLSLLGQSDSPVRMEVIACVLGL